MAFNFKNKDKSGLPTLTEEDIRNRLYGSAVGVSPDFHHRPHKKEKRLEAKEGPLQKEPDNEQSKVKEELLLLKKELAQAKKRLERMRSVKTKKIRLLLVSFSVIAACTILTAFIIMGILNARHERETARPAQVSQPGGHVPAGDSYAVQVATYGSLSLAEKFSDVLKSKGYSTFIHKTQYESGRDKFIVYVGRFADKKGASKILGRIREIEGAEDSFVVTSPRG